MQTLKFAFPVVLGIILSAVANAQNAAAMPSPDANQDRSSEVKYFPKDEVLSAFQKGATILQGANYRVMTAKREEPGQVEIHTKFTDVFYIAEGNATIVVGGKAVGAKSTEPDELRGTSIEGGQTRELSAGDVIVIPAGIPHWINKVQPPFHYFVVKIELQNP